MKHIAIAGAGPAGVATALLLARQGLKVTLVEQEQQFDRVFRGEGLMPAGLAALYDMGLKAAFAKIPSRRLDAWDFYVGGQRRMRVVEPEEKGVATHIIDQGSLLKAMVAEADSLPGFELCLGWQGVELLRDHKSKSVIGLRARTKGKQGGQSRDILCDGVIAADGRYSRLRKLAGLALDSTSASSDLQFDVLWFKLPAPVRLQQETPFIVCLQPDRQFAFYPSWDGRLQIGWIVRKGKAADYKNCDWIEEFAAALPPALAVHFRSHRNELEGPIFLEVNVGCCDRWHLPGFLMIGDAAHPMAPNRAQGINMALRDAIVVANHMKTVDSRNGLVPYEVFQQIQAERQPEIEAVQKMQLAEWKKVEFISTPGLPYQGFKAIASLFGRFQFAQNIWLQEQQGLRQGVLPVKLAP